MYIKIDSGLSPLLIMGVIQHFLFHEEEKKDFLPKLNMDSSPFVTKELSRRL